VRREQLLHLVRETARIAGRAEIVVIGSQAIHAVMSDVPADVIVSLECDVLFDANDPAIEVVKRGSD
jgi:hypothetical protein